MPAPDGYLPNEPAPGGKKGGGKKGDAADRIYDALNNLPLPTQGQVADLIDLVSFPGDDGMPQISPPINAVQMIVDQAVEEAAAPTAEEQLMAASKMPPTPPGRTRPTLENRRIDPENPPPQFISMPAAGPGGLMTTMTPNPAYAEWVREKRQQDMRDQRNANAADLGDKDKGKEPFQRGEVTQLTWDEYNALSEPQRAAVDFNTLLVQAVNRDRRLNRKGMYDDVTETQQKTYDLAEQRLFGSEGGSKRYAPETLALMEQLDLGGQADFDDFLKLRVAITDQDLKVMKEHPWQNPEASAKLVKDFDRAERDRFQQVFDFAGNTLEMQQEMAQAGALLENVRKTAALDRERQLQVQEFGGTVNKPEGGLGFGVGQRDAQGYALNLDAYFQDRFDMLADANSQYSSNQILDAVKSYLKPDQLQQFYNYIDIRSANAEKFALPLGGTEGVQYRTPEEFRKLLGIGR